MKVTVPTIEYQIKQCLACGGNGAMVRLKTKDRASVLFNCQFCHAVYSNDEKTAFFLRTLLSDAIAQLGFEEDRTSVQNET